jgi:hypothetical protein
LQETIVSAEYLAAEYHPAHAAYIYAQNRISLMVEQLSALEFEELAALEQIALEAEEEYMPSGPPISPLTTSYFTCWSLFDVYVGKSKETLGSIAIEVAAAFGMRAELLRVMRLMQASRMGIYVNEGIAADGNDGSGRLITLRELANDRVCRAIFPAGCAGAVGDLLYLRVLPPPLAHCDEHVAFTTPYILMYPGSSEWTAYFDRVLPCALRLQTFERHMKYGPSRYYWTEFVFEAYVNHRTEAIFLAGLPDLPHTRPHSREYQARQ